MKPSQDAADRHKTRATASGHDKETVRQRLADRLIDPTFTAAALQTRLLADGSGSTLVEVNDLAGPIAEMVARVKGGSLEDAEAFLVTQASTLNTLWANLLLRASQTPDLEKFELYIRLALKAQAQCRSALEALALVKNPPVFARQANFAQGPQQINNGPVLNSAPARAEISESAPTKLLTGGSVNGERMDGGAEGEAGRGDLSMVPVAALNRAADRRGKGARVAQRLQGRGTAEAPRIHAPCERVPAGAGSVVDSVCL